MCKFTNGSNLHCLPYLSILLVHLLIPHTPLNAHPTCREVTHLLIAHTPLNAHPTCREVTHLLIAHTPLNAHPTCREVTVLTHRLFGHLERLIIFKEKIDRKILLNWHKPGSTTANHVCTPCLADIKPFQPASSVSDMAGVGSIHGSPVSHTLPALWQLLTNRYGTRHNRPGWQGT